MFDIWIYGCVHAANRFPFLFLHPFCFFILIQNLFIALPLLFLISNCGSLGLVDWLSSHSTCLCHPSWLAFIMDQGGLNTHSLCSVPLRTPSNSQHCLSPPFQPPHLHLWPSSLSICSKHCQNGEECFTNRLEQNRPVTALFEWRVRLRINKNVCSTLKPGLFETERFHYLGNAHVLQTRSQKIWLRFLKSSICLHGL